MKMKFGKFYLFGIPLLFFSLFGMIKYSYGSSIVGSSLGADAVSNRSSVQLQGEDVDFKENLYGKEMSKEKCNSCGAANLCSPSPVQRLNQILPGRDIPSAWIVMDYIVPDSGLIDATFYAVKDYPGGSPVLFAEPRRYTTNLNTIALDHYNRNQLKLGHVLERLVSNKHSFNYIIVSDSIVKWLNPRHATTFPTLPWSQQSFTVLIETGPDNRVSRTQIKRLAAIISSESPSLVYSTNIKFLFDINELTSEVDKGLGVVQWSTSKIANIDEIRAELCLLKP